MAHAGSASLAVSLDDGHTFLPAPASFTFLFPQPKATAREAAAAVKPKPSGAHRKLLTSDDWWPARFGQFYGFYSNAEAAEYTSLCISASTPAVGPEAGGTRVTLKLAGDLPENHQVFYCKFDDEVGSKPASDSSLGLRFEPSRRWYVSAFCGSSGMQGQVTPVSRRPQLSRVRTGALSALCMCEGACSVFWRAGRDLSDLRASGRTVPCREPSLQQPH